MPEIPLVSVVIATRNRHKYAKPAIRSLSTSIRASDAEFVVQDSGDDASLGDFIQSEIRDPRVRYFYTPPPLNMTENYDIAMGRATGRYVCMIGDDDSVNPEMMEAARWAAARDIDSLTPTAVANYFWPDFHSRYYGDRHGGRIYLGRISGRFTRLNLEKAIRFCVHTGARVIDWTLPRVYLGMIRRDRLEEIRRRTGHYFAGISPDMYGAMTAATVCRNAWKMDYPLIMGGSSGGSNAGLSARRRHKGTFQESAHMRNYSVDDWLDGVPRYWTTEIAYSSAALVALRALGREDLIREFNYSFLHARCLISHPDYYAETFRSFRRSMHISGMGGFRGWSRFAGYCALEAFRRSCALGQRLMHPGPAGGAEAISGLQDIQVALTALRDRLKADSMSFRKYVDAYETANRIEDKAAI